MHYKHAQAVLVSGQVKQGYFVSAAVRHNLYV